MVVDHWRVRVCGPGFPLLVARCRVHAVGFTVYPPGWVPYGRMAVAPARLDGGHGGNWDGSLFAEALAVAGGRVWDWEMCGTPVSWTTEYRWLDRCERVAGLAEDQGQGLQHAIAETLGVPLMTLIDAASGAREGRPAYVARAQAVRQVLEAPVLAVAWRRVVVAGHLAGAWGRPLWVGPAGDPEEISYRHPGTRRGGAEGDAAIGSTTSARDPPAAPP